MSDKLALPLLSRRFGLNSAHHRPIPPIDPDVPGMFRYGDQDRVVRDFSHAGFTVDHVEDMDVPIFEAETAAECVAFLRALGSGLAALLNDLSPDDQRAWEDDVAKELEQMRANGMIRLGGVTRIVRARPDPDHS